MYEQERVDLAQYRMDKAQEALTDARDALRQGRLANAANRSYYALKLRSCKFATFWRDLIK